MTVSEAITWLSRCPDQDAELTDNNQDEIMFVHDKGSWVELSTNPYPDGDIEELE